MADRFITREASPRLVTLDRSFEWKAKADDTGVFEGYASTFGNEDSYGDTIIKGAFLKSLAARAASGQKVKMLWNHSRMEPIGIYTKASEDNHGLYVEGKLTKGVPRADQTLLLMKDGAIDSMSIGGYVVKELFDNKTGKSELQEIDLQEISPVTFPANTQATISTVKAVEECVTIRELEAYLRDVGGFSAAAAKAFIAKARGAKSEQRDAADEIAELLKTAINNLSK